MAKQINDYRNKQHDAYLQINRQRGQNAAGVNRQCGQNDGANRQRVEVSQSNSREPGQNMPTKRFFLSNGQEKPPIRERESTFSSLQPKRANTDDIPHKTKELLERVSPSWSSLTAIDLALTLQNIPVVSLARSPSFYN